MQIVHVASAFGQPLGHERHFAQVLGQMQQIDTRLTQESVPGDPV
jgi:hypothetical protein